MNQPLRIGLIGAGMVSRHHLIAWASLSDQARVVAVADPSSENAARRASEFAIPQISASAEAMLAECELDAIDIAAPREMHAPLVRLAAAKRLPVLCQKPLAPNLQEAVELAGCVLAATRGPGESDSVVNDVLVVRNDGAFDVPGTFGLQVPFDH